MNEPFDPEIESAADLMRDAPTEEERDSALDALVKKLESN